MDGEQVLLLAQRGDFKKLNKMFAEAEDPAVVAAALAYADEDGYTALHRASYNGRVQTIQLLIKAGASTSARTGEGWEPLHCAARWNQLGAMELLLSANANINARTNGGLTPAMLACTQGVKCKEAVAYLLCRADLDKTITTAEGDTCIDFLERGTYGALAELANPALAVDMDPSNPFTL